MQRKIDMQCTCAHASTILQYLAIAIKGASFNYFDMILAFSTTYLPRWHLRRNSFIIEGQISLLLTIPVPPTVLRLVNVVCERPPSCRLDIIYVAIEICHIRAISIICTYITQGNIKVSTSPRHYLVFLSRYSIVRNKCRPYVY